MASEADYSQFTSMQEIIFFETEVIASISDSEPAMLSIAYIDRAESLIIAEDAISAIDDLKNGLYYTSFCLKKTEKDLLLCRGLFDLCIAYAAADRIDELKSTMEEFQFVLSNLYSNDWHYEYDCPLQSYETARIVKNSTRNKQRGYILNCSSSGDWPIIKGKFKQQFSPFQLAQEINLLSPEIFKILPIRRSGGSSGDSHDRSGPYYEGTLNFKSGPEGTEWSVSGRAGYQDGNGNYVEGEISRNDKGETSGSARAGNEKSDAKKN